jgi:hypothetical protein
MPDSDFRLTGGCGCGAVRFAIDVPLATALYCHCTRCQRRTGTGSAASGRAVPLCASDPESGDIRGVRLGAIDGDPGIRPQAHQFVAYAAPWEPIPDDGLPRYEERMPD